MGVDAGALRNPKVERVVCATDAGRETAVELKAMTPEQQRVWMEQWRSAASALAEYKAARLRALTAEEAFAESDVLLSLARPVTPDEARYSWSGLVEQQAIFHGRHRK